MGFVIGYSQNGFHIITGSPGRLFSQSGTASVQPGKLHNTCPKDTGIAHVLTAQRQSQGTSLHIGGRTHRRPLSFPCHAVRYHSTVPCCIYIRKVGAHFIIHQDSTLKHLHSCLLAKACIRTDPYG